jgi:hypothetical protein
MFPLKVGGMAVLAGGLFATVAAAEPLPWQPAPQQSYQGVQYYPNYQSGSGYQDAQATPYGGEPAPDPYRPGDSPGAAPAVPRAYTNDAYVPPTNREAPAAYQRAPVETYQPDYGGSAERYQNDGGDSYRDEQRYDDRAGYRDPRGRYPDPGGQTYSQNEVVDAGHRFFGSLSSGLAKAVEWAFQNAGRPNGYILGEGAGGAFIAGLRYGEGTLYTKHAGVHRVFWQGPSLGYDFGGDGTRTMILVYNLRSPRDVYTRFAGVQGSAYLVGGASVQLLKGDEVTLAPIRTGVGLRLGANIGYLKFTRRPTWNPF